MAYRYENWPTRQYGNVVIPSCYKVIREDGSYYFLGKQIYDCNSFPNLWGSNVGNNWTMSCNGYNVVGWSRVRYGKGGRWCNAYYNAKYHLVPVCSWQHAYDDRNNQSGASISLVNKAGSSQTLISGRQRIWNTPRHFLSDSVLAQVTDPRKLNTHSHLYFWVYNGDRHKDAENILMGCGVGWSFAYEPTEFQAIYGFHAC